MTWRLRSMLALALTASMLPGIAGAQGGPVAKRLPEATPVSCSAGADDFFLLVPVAPRTVDAGLGGTVADVAQDGFTAVGLSFQTGAAYQLEEQQWRDSGLCLVRRLWPTRTVVDEQSPAYFGPPGSLVRAAETRSAPCERARLGSLAARGCVVEEIADASDAQMDAWVAQIEQEVIDALSDPVLDARIVAWYVGPEELRPNVPREMELLERLYDTVKTLDPLDRPAWMYNPQHSSAERLVMLGQAMDALTVGIYPHTADNVHRRIQVRHAMTQMTAAKMLLELNILGLKKRVIPSLEMFESDSFPYAPADAARVGEFVRHDAYAAFANGAEGLMIWSMGHRPGFATYADYYDAWAAVAEETLELGLRDVLLHGEVQAGAEVTVLLGEPTIDFDWVTASGAVLADATYPSVSVRHWLYEATDYVLLVNSSQGPVELTLDGVPAGAYRDLLAGGSRRVGARGLHVELPALGVLLLASGIDGFATDKVTP